MDRTNPHRANLKDDYSLVKKATESDKKQKIMNEWILSKISNAYIRIDSEYQKCVFKNQWLNQ
jgi:peptidyl-prolyl cis-trans isomerase SurA